METLFFDTIAGIPIHPLVVHAVVVLAPLYAVTLVYFISKNKFSRFQGFLLFGAAIVAGSAFLANQSGEVLASRVGLPQSHALYGKYTTIVSGLVFLILLTYWVLGSKISRSLQRLARIFLVILSIFSILTVVLAGHSGAQSVWEKRIAGTHVGDHPTE